jgi:hypothetical protein
MSFSVEYHYTWNEKFSDRTFLFASGSAALAETVVLNTPFDFIGFELHCSGAGTTDDLAVTVDAAAGSAWDTVLYDESMNGRTNVFRNWPLNETPMLVRGDELDFAWDNSGSLTWGLKVVVRRYA